MSNDNRPTPSGGITNKLVVDDPLTNGFGHLNDLKPYVGFGWASQSRTVTAFAFPTTDYRAEVSVTVDRATAKSKHPITNDRVADYITSKLAMFNVADVVFAEWSINPTWTGKDARRSTSRQGDIYFVRDEQGFIKIGFSTRVAQRIAELRTSTRQELTLLATEPGTSDRERELHRTFKHLHERGEWFRPGAELVDHIDSLRVAA